MIQTRGSLVLFLQTNTSAGCVFPITTAAAGSLQDNAAILKKSKCIYVAPTTPGENNLVIESKVEAVTTNVGGTNHAISAV